MSSRIKRFITYIYNSFLKITKNIVWLIGLSFVIAICQFFLYALINKNLGKESLGIWSLIVAATSIGQISNFGFSNSLVRYLPEMLLKNDKSYINRFLGTINFSNFFLTLPTLLLLYFPAIRYASSLLKDQQLLVFKSIIPLSMAALFINNLFSVYSYLLDSMQKYYVRAIIQIGGWIFFLILSALLMPKYALMGIALAFFTQNILQFVAIIIIVSKSEVLQKIYPVNFDKIFFRQIFSFGLKSQLISILVIFFDPLVKFFITKNIGLSATANYEICNKVTLQARNLLVSTNQVIVPKIVLQKKNGTENGFFYSISSRNILLSIAAGLLVLLVAPIFVYFFSKQYDHTLLPCIIILNMGWVCNMVTSVHYYCCIGLDKIGRLVIYHMLLSIIVLAIYFFLHHYLHWKALYFAAPSIALFLGSIYNSYALSKKIKNSFAWLKSFGFLYFIFVSFIFLIIAYLKPGILSYWIMPIFCLIYIYWILISNKKFRLFKSPTS